MKNKEEQNRDFQNYPISKKEIFSQKIKTTNVNILLNRVRVEKRKNFNKKLIIFSLLISLIAITFFFLS